MPKLTSSSSTLNLAQVKRLFDQWRKRHAQGGRIPQHLWQAAAHVAAEHGVHLVADRLHLDVARLAQWVEELGAESLAAPPPSAGNPLFVEMPSLLAPVAECVLEIEEPGGRKLRVSLKGQAVTQASSVASALWKEDTA